MAIATESAISKEVGAFLAVSVVALGVPGLFSSAAARLFNPDAELPAFTLLAFEIKTDPDDVHMGRPVTIETVLRGPIVPAKAQLVYDDANGRRTFEMVAGGEGEFLLRLERPMESARFQIRTSEGRSAWQALVVRPEPVIESVRLRLEPVYDTAFS